MTSYICYGLNCVPSKRYIEILSPSSSKSKLIWKQDLYEVSEFKWGHAQP